MYSRNYGGFDYVRIHLELLTSKLKQKSPDIRLRSYVMKKVVISIALIFTYWLAGCSDPPSFEGDKIIGTWFLEKRIDTYYNSVKEFDVSEMKYKITFFTKGKFEHIDETGTLNGKWRNKGNGLYRFSDDGGLLNWSSGSIVEFIGDSAMSYHPPFSVSTIDYCVKLNK